ncbi:MAG: serine--tRNA ligase, partial [Desulfobulbia bacterium]
MYNIRWIRDHPEQFDEAMAKRGLEPNSEVLLDLDKERRACITILQEAQTRRNLLSKEIGKAKSSGDDDSADALIQ